MTETKNSEPSTEYQVPSTKPPFSYATLLRDLKEKKPALMADLKMARYELRDTTLLLIFSKEWNYTRVNTAPVKNLITESLE